MGTRILAVALCVFVVCGLAAGARADPILGTWQVEPDHKGQVGQVVIRRCGEGFCGRVMQVFDRAGRSVVTRSMGRDLFWNLRPAGDGRYEGGEVWVPLYDKVYAAKARLRGDRLTVRGCIGPICDGQTWQRIR